MRTKVDRLLAICIVSFGLPIILAGRGQWELALIGATLFFLAYFLLPFSKALRQNVKYLEVFVFSSYFIVFVGCWLLYSNGFNNKQTFLLYVLVVALGFPVFKKLETYIKQSKGSE